MGNGTGMSGSPTRAIHETLPRTAFPVAPLAAALLGFAWFVQLGGLRALDPSNLDWIIGDHAQHLLGWLFFRNEDWRLPLGAIGSLLYPVGTTIGFTDSNPWVAVLLRPFSGVLPADFQFIGAWLALSFTLQGWYGARIMEALGARPVAQLAGAALFILAPPLVRRLGHDTLTAHWLLLALVWLNLRRTRNVRGTLVHAAVLNVVAAGVHPYLAAMVLALTVALLARLVVDQLLPVGAAAAAGAVTMSLVAGVFLLFGYLGTSAELESGGFGLYSADLLALINPFDYSRWLPALPAGEGQYEGFGYLGAGGVGLAVAALVVARLRGVTLRPAPSVVPLTIAAMLMFVFALSDHVTVAGRIVLTMRSLYDLAGSLVESMRASGRFVWPLHYLALTGALAVVVRRDVLKPAVATALIVAAAAAQAVERRPEPLFYPHGWKRLAHPVWARVGVSYRHFVLYPGYYPVGPGECPASSLEWSEVRPLAYEAYRQRMTFNSGYVARVPMEALRRYCASLDDDVAAGRLDPRSVYVVEPDRIEAFTRAGATCGTLDAYHVCVAPVVGGPFRRALEENPVR